MFQSVNKLQRQQESSSMDKRIKIGVIAATPEFIEAAARIAEQKDVDLVTSRAGLEAAVDAGRRMEADEVEVIISWRGGADFLQRKLRIPTLSVHTSSFDLLESIQEAKKIGRNILVPNYKDQLSRFDLLSEIFDVTIVSRGYDDSPALEEVIRWGKHQGCEVVIGGGISMQLAMKHGLKGVVFRPNEENLRATIDDAVAIARINRQNQARSANYRSIIDAVAEGMVSVDPGGKITAMNQTAMDVLQVTYDQVVGQDIYRFIPGERIQSVLQTGRPSWDAIEKIGNETYLMNHIPLLVESKVAGAVTTFTEVSKLMHSENKVRHSLAKSFKTKYTLDNFVHQCQRMKLLVHKTAQYAQTDATVLIMGETGTGKEILAQGIHNLSARARGPFVSINLAALPDQLLESELFGHDEGAFTGARRGGKPGLFELAHKGTIFLDEIGAMPLLLQSRLLRVLQEREVMRIGGNHLIPVDVRVIAATNKSLSHEVQEGKFREDLLFRLNVLSLRVPSLRERIEDLPLLVEELLRRSAAKFKVSPISIPSSHQEKLMQLSWPGNVRQLQNAIEKLVILSDGTWSSSPFDEVYEELLEYSKIQCGTMEMDPSSPSEALRKKAIEDEAKMIISTLKEVGYSKRKAAERLGMCRTTLWRRLKEIKH
jgi:transcriptional regulator with PAS, ATPase and Fis domain